MNWDAIGALSEAIGALAVVITLLYLAIQIKEQTKETRLTATRDLSRDYREVVGSITADKEVFDLYLRALTEYEELPYEERIRISLYFFRLFRMSGLSYLHHLNQKIGSETILFETGQFRLTDVANAPGAIAWWERNRHSFSEEYRNYADRYILRGLSKN